MRTKEEQLLDTLKEGTDNAGAKAFEAMGDEFPHLYDVSNMAELADELEAIQLDMFRTRFHLAKLIGTLNSKSFQGSRRKSIVEGKRRGYPYKFRRINLLKSTSELLVLELLDSWLIPIATQWHSGRYSYDFYVKDYNLLIEVDGTGHRTDSDLDKQEWAEGLGFCLERIPVPSSHTLYYGNTAYLRVQTRVQEIYDIYS